MTSATISNSRTRTENTAASSPTSETGISEQDVAAYLVRHPDFFRQHSGILADMSLPHNSGNAVSLVERQVAILRDRSMQTRHKLGELIEAAKDNDALFNTTQSLVIELLQADSLNSVFEIIEQRLTQQFGVESYSILFISDDQASDASGLAPRFIKSKTGAEQYIAGIIDNSQSLCGTLRDGEADFIFADAQRKIGSVAIACRKTSATESDSSLIMLAVAHHDPSHYNSETGTLFLDYLCDILSALVKRQL